MLWLVGIGLWLTIASMMLVWVVWAQRSAELDPFDVADPDGDDDWDRDDGVDLDDLDILP